MQQKKKTDRILMGIDLPGETLPGTSIVEILDNGRVLIEKQAGVCSYSSSCIRVKVGRGIVCISGESLVLQRLSSDQLVITGVIFSVSLVDWR